MPEQLDFQEYGLGWSEPDPSHRGHEALYSAAEVFGDTPVTVNYGSDPRLDVATLEDYNQGREGACVGFGLTRERTIVNGKKYAARWAYLKAQDFDPWPGRNYSGTTVHAGIEVLLKLGHVVSDNAHAASGTPALEEGIESAVWARTVDQMRSAFAAAAEKQVPFGIIVGCNWYRNFFTPEEYDGRYWVGRELPRWGRVAGGHCICLDGAFDRWDAFRGVQSWGSRHPYPFYMSYDGWDRLLREGAEVAIVTDRVAPGPLPVNPVAPTDPWKGIDVPKLRQLLGEAKERLESALSSLPASSAPAGSAGQQSPAGTPSQVTDFGGSTAGPVTCEDPMTSLRRAEWGQS